MPTVREALAAGHFYVAMQPIVDLERRRIFAYEALLRSKSPDFNEGPIPILKAAVAEGAMGELGRALRQMAVDATPSGHVFLNVHPSEFDEGWLVRPDDPIFAHSDVYLEITESVPLSHFEMCQSVLRELRARGVFLVVDDLGAGYSNLKYIADLYPEVVKLDRDLIMNLEKQPRLQKLVTAIVRLCADLGAKVVAEGIETPEELAAVMRTGVHYAQGYLLARPALPAPTVDWSSLPMHAQAQRR
jgi:EAL domain-containing protein (putative c-di-GMP-specific phosphodiesterase class I)